MVMLSVLFLTMKIFLPVDVCNSIRLGWGIGGGPKPQDVVWTSFSGLLCAWESIEQTELILHVYHRLKKFHC